MPDKPKDTSHPADGLLEAIKGIFNGDNARQSLRDAYDRITSKPAPPAPDPVAAQTKANNDKAVQAANKSFLDADQAARIRAQANK